MSIGNEELLDMSANTDEPTTPDAPTTDHDRLAQLEERIDDLEATVADQEETIAEQQETIDEQAERIGELEATIERDIDPRLDAFSTQLSSVRELLATDGIIGDEQYERFVEEHGGVLDQFIEPNTGVLGKLEDEIEGEKRERSIADAKLEQRVGRLADAADIDVDDSDMMGDDKIRTAMRDGAKAVENTVYPSHERAVDLLRNIDDVGTHASDTYGRRFTVDTPAAKEFFRVHSGENLASSQIKRVFEKIEDWGADSPRRVTADSSGDTNRLKIHLEQEDTQ